MEPEPALFILLSGLNITFFPITINVIIEILILLVLFVSSALISGSEVAYFSLEPSDIKNLKQSKSSKDLLILKHYQNPKKLLATILISNNFINVGIIILSSLISTTLFDFSKSPTIEFIVQVILITFILLLFSEILPKVYASYKGVKYAHFMAYPLRIIAYIFNPLSIILVSSTSFVNNKFHRKYNLSIKDLSEAIKITTNDIKKGEKKILKGIVKFGEIDVTEIMKSRVDVVSLNINKSYKNVISTIIESGFSRIPVYEETLDNIKGILIVKDLLPYIDPKDDFNWQELIKSPYFVPETKKIDDLFEEFRKNKTHMAIVIDEYGGSSGIITMEDIIEEIVGEINDENDTDEFLYHKINDLNYIFEGKTLLNDFYKITNLNENIFDDIKGEAETLAGLILEIKEEIPQQGDIIIVKQFEFIIDLVDFRRIKRLKLKIYPGKIT